MREQEKPLDVDQGRQLRRYAHKRTSLHPVHARFFLSAWRFSMQLDGPGRRSQTTWRQFAHSAPGAALHPAQVLPPTQVRLLHRAGQGHLTVSNYHRPGLILRSAPVWFLLQQGHGSQVHRGVSAADRLAYMRIAVAGTGTGPHGPQKGHIQPTSLLELPPRGTSQYIQTSGTDKMADKLQNAALAPQPGCVVHSTRHGHRSFELRYAGLGGKTLLIQNAGPTPGQIRPGEHSRKLPPPGERLAPLQQILQQDTTVVSSRARARARYAGGLHSDPGPALHVICGQHMLTIFKGVADRRPLPLKPRRWCEVGRRSGLRFRHQGINRVKRRQTAHLRPATRCCQRPRNQTPSLCEGAYEFCSSGFFGTRTVLVLAIFRKRDCFLVLSAFQQEYRGKGLAVCL